MKKCTLIMLSAAMSFAACQEVEAPLAEENVLSAVIEQDETTKTEMDENNNILWSANDQIIAFMKSSYGHKYNLIPSYVGKAYADFEPVSSGIGGNLSAGSEWDHNVAYYPYSSSVECLKSGSNYTLDVVLPSEQTYAAESFGNGFFPMVAVSENNNIAFKNVLGGMKLQLRGTQKVKSIKLEGKNNEKLAGAATVTAYADETNPAITMASGASTSVTLNCGTGVQLNESKATEFIIVLPPLTFTKGFTVTVTDSNDEDHVIETSKSNEVKRSSLLAMPEMALNGIPSDPEPQEGDYIDEYGINHGSGIAIGNVVWAPVNCGYNKTDYPYGKLYQWGRKYGQGYNGNIYDATGDKIGEYSDATIPMIEEGGISVMTGNDKSNADIFYTRNTNYYGWKDCQDGKLWNYGTEDNPVKTEYDPCPDGWRVPTYAELDELRQNHSNWTYENEQLGYWFSGSVPYSSSVFKVFFSAAGLRGHDGLANERNTRGCYWSSRSNDNRKTHAYCLSFYDNRTTMGTIGQNYAYGFSVRCVKYDGELIPVSSLILDETSISMAVGEVFSIPATINPSNASHQYICWRSDDPSIAIVDSGGTVTAVSAGTTTITAVAGMQVATCKITVSDYNMKYYIDEYGVNHGKGVKIGDVVWAPVNCGYHKNDFKYGKLYQWGRKYGQGYSGNIYDANWYKIGEYSDASLPMIEEGGISIMTGNDMSNADIFYTGTSDLYDWADNQGDKLWNSGTEDNPVKTEYDPCPDGWRVPTYAELDELRQNHSNWTYENEQLGYWFSGSVPYSSSVFKVFFPAAGYRFYDGITYNRGGRAYYYSSITYNNFAYCLWFTNSGEPDILYGKRACGYSVRCVQE